ncbi:hypothetical protein EYF80_037181 [Liparis tanakae]|uniref:Uncharacterized protein n=1 Tax=Liparis tanakae TaxID=230148 RepID=A0A4Z2GI96_9TELE|nr:hypothetical protein EYF80_037181 [Liparis tanakae]
MAVDNMSSSLYGSKTQSKETSIHNQGQMVFLFKLFISPLVTVCTQLHALYTVNMCLVTPRPRKPSSVHTESCLHVENEFFSRCIRTRSAYFILLNVFHFIH